MDIRQIHYILTMANVGNMTQAARQLHISQSALSQTYKNLEKELGLVLFRKEGRNLILTEDGRFFCKRGQLLVEEMETFVHDLEARKQLSSHIIHYFTDVVDNCDETMIQFQHYFPDVDFHRYYGSNQDAIHSLLTNEIDLALLLRHTSHPELASLKLIDEPVVVLLPPEHPLAAQDSLWISQLSGETLTIYQNAESLRDLFDEFFANGGAVIRKTLEVYDPFIQIQSGMGFIFMPQSTFMYFHENKMLGSLVGVLVKDDFCRRRVFLTYKKNLSMTRLLNGYFNYLKVYHQISQQECCLPGLDRFAVDGEYQLVAK